MEQGTSGSSACKRPEYRGIGRPITDRIGQKFGKLTVVSFVDTKPGHARWLCQCDCGNEVVLMGGNLLKAVGCGCEQSAPRGGRRPGEASRKHVLTQYQRNAQRRGLTWELADEDFDRLISSDCHYCGNPPSRIYKGGQYDGGTLIYSGLDRRDNDAGYIPGNVIPCCTDCNRAKSNMSFDDFMAWIARLTEHHWFHPELTPSRLLAGGA